MGSMCKYLNDFGGITLFHQMWTEIKPATLG